MESKFCQWAFGDTYEKYVLLEANALEMMQYWNEHHGKEFDHIVKEDDGVIESIIKMIECYELQKEKQA